MQDIMFHTTGQSSQTACLAGTYQADTGQTDCDDANAGLHVPTSGQSSQTAMFGRNLSSMIRDRQIVMTQMLVIMFQILGNQVKLHAWQEPIKPDTGSTGLLTVMMQTVGSHVSNNRSI